MDRNTKTIIICVILLASAIGVGVFYYSQEKNIESSPMTNKAPKGTVEKMNKDKQERETARYINEKYGFFLDYSVEKYYIAEETSRGGATGEESDSIKIIRTDEPKRIHGIQCPAVSIFISKSSLEQELKDLEFSINGETEKVMIDNIEATKKSGEITENIPPCDHNEVRIVFDRSGDVFIISAFKNQESALNEILETIRFN